MKKFVFAVVAFLLSLTASAANPYLVKGFAPNGQAIVLSMETPYTLYKDTATLQAVVRSALGEQRMADNAGWTQYGKLLTACGAKCLAVPGAANGKVINPNAGAATCSTFGGVTQSVVSFPNWTETITNDGCGFHTVVNGQAN